MANLCFCQFAIEMFDPHTNAPRREIEELQNRLSSTLRSSPARTQPKIETPDPKRAMVVCEQTLPRRARARSDIDDAKIVFSNTLRAAPHVVVVLTERRLPKTA